MELNIEYLKQVLELRGWSVRQLAQQSGLSPATISRVINRKRTAGEKTLSGIKKALPKEPTEKLFFLS